MIADVCALGVFSLSNSQTCVNLFAYASCNNAHVSTQGYMINKTLVYMHTDEDICDYVHLTPHVNIVFGTFRPAVWAA